MGSQEVSSIAQISFERISKEFHGPTVDDWFTQCPYVEINNCSLYSGCCAPGDSRTCELVHHISNSLHGCSICERAKL